MSGIGGTLPLVAASAFAFVLIAALHWAPWPAWFKDGITPPWTYMVGTATITGTIIVWMIWTRPAFPLSLYGVLAITAATGIGDVLVYGLDLIGDARRRERHHDPH